MRKAYVVSYDISNSKRLAKVYKAMRGFGDHAQYSVFICELSDMERVLMIQKLEGIIHHKDDRVMIVDLGLSDGRGSRCIQTLGRQYLQPERHAIVV